MRSQEARTNLIAGDLKMPVPRYIDSVGGGRHNRDGRTRPKSQSQGTALQFTGILSSVDPPFRTRHRHGLSYCRVRSFPVDWHAPENSMTGWFFSRRPLLVLSCLVLSVGIGTGVVGSGTSASGRSKQNLEEDRLTLRYLLDPVPSPVGGWPSPLPSPQNVECRRQ